MAFTEFFVGGVSASNTNGGGPRIGAAGAPIYTTVNATVLGGSTTTVTDNSGSNWAGCLIDDFMCWDTAGVQTIHKITNIVGANATIATAAAAGANKTVNVCGAWATCTRSGAILTTSTINAASNPPRANILAGTYNEQFTIIASGSATIPITYEGYEVSAGDGCPTGNRPIISGTAASGHGITSAAQYLDVRNLNATTNVAGKHGITLSGSYNLLINCVGSTGSSATNGDAIQLSGASGSMMYRCYVSAAKRYAGYLNNSSVAINCAFVGAGSYGLYLNANAIVIGCIVSTAASHGIYCFSSGNRIAYCNLYSNGGSGIYRNATYVPLEPIIGCIFDSNAAFGIAGANNYFCVEDYNAFWNNTSGQVSNVFIQGSHDVTLTASPFTNAAGGDFTLNSLAGAGAACRGTGAPGAMIYGGTGYSDIGPLQHLETLGGITSRIGGGIR